METQDVRPLLLLVDDDEEIGRQMKWALCETHQVLVAGDRSTGLRLFASHRPGLVLLDLGLPPCPNSTAEGMRALEDFLALEPGCKVVVLTGQSDASDAARAIRMGAFDFLAKPVPVEALRVILERASQIAAWERVDPAAAAPVDQVEGMLGASGAMRRVFGEIGKLSASDVPVLVSGESGTGKEMVARALHRRSRRGEAAFVPVNCGAIPEALIESELFGHEKGAFTGAHAPRPGLVQTASGGTLFLDEVGELPLPMQVKLLRFLQERRVRPVGGRQDLAVDVRVIAATNRDLEAEVGAGRFRQDLYFRLAVVQIRMPALRERGEDVRLLAEVFRLKFNGEGGVPVRGFTAEALQAIQRHAWPGNVRELENRVRRAVVMAEGARIRSSDLELSAAEEVPGRTLREAREELEREMLVQALRRHQGRVSGAAQELGLSRPTVYELMEKFDLRKADAA